MDEPTLTDIFIDGMDFDRIEWWVGRLGVTLEDIAVWGLREALKLRVVSDDIGIQADREVIKSVPF